MGDLEESMTDWEAFQHAASKSEMKPTLNHKVFDEDKKTIALIGDTHIGSKFFTSESEDILKKNIDWCLENNSPVILMGDMIETATRNSVGAGVYESNEIVDQQIQHFEYLFKDLAVHGLIMGIHPGNHELRIYQSSGLNITKQMARNLDIKFLGWGKLHYLRVGDQAYSMYTTHGSSGARMPHTKIKAAIDLSRLAEAEIYAMGHLHVLDHHVSEFYRINTRKKTVDRGEKHFLITGAYLQHWGSYGHIKSYEPVKRGSVKVKLNGKEHGIRVTL